MTQLEMTPWNMCKVYGLNLLCRDDRHEHLTRQFAELGIQKYEICRYHKRPTDPAKNIFENVIDILEKGLSENNEAPIMIFEDDISILKDALYQLENITLFLANPPRSWDTVRLGYSKPIYVEKINDHLYRGNAVGTFCTIYSPQFASKLIRSYKNRVKPYEQLDQILARISGRHILTARNIFGQAAFQSDNNWGAKCPFLCKDYFREFNRDHESYLKKYNDIGARYKDTKLPMFIVYYTLMSRYHNWHRILGFSTNKIRYELKDITLPYPGR